MARSKGGIDEAISHGTISHGTIYNAFNRQSPAPPPPVEYEYWIDDGGDYFFSDEDEFYISG
jgi:hypothetical protein